MPPARCNRFAQRKKIFNTLVVNRSYVHPSGEHRLPAQIHCAVTARYPGADRQIGGRGERPLIFSTEPGPSMPEFIDLKQIDKVSDAQKQKRPSLRRSWRRTGHRLACSRNGTLKNHLERRTAGFCIESLGSFFFHQPPAVFFSPLAQRVDHPIERTAVLG